MRTRSASSIDGVLRSAILVLATGLLAGGLLIAGSNAGRSEIWISMGITALAICFLLAGNHRLFCLYGIIIVAPLALSKNFVPIPNMGGAGSFAIDAVDPLVLILLGFQLRDIAAGRARWTVTPMAKWVAAMMALGVVQMVLWPTGKVTAGQWSANMLTMQELVRMAKCYLLFFVIVNEVVRERQVMHVLVAIIGAVVLQSMLGIVQGVFRIDLGLQRLGEAGVETIKQAATGTYAGRGASEGFRSNALLGHPNLLSAFLAMQLPICIALMFSRLSAFVRMMLGVAVLLGSAALIMTLSRSGWFSFAAAVVLLFALSFVHPRLQRRFLFARVAAIAFMVIIAASFSGAIIRRFTESDPGALNFRLEWNRAAWGMVAEQPVFGFGLNTFIYHLPGRTNYGAATGLTDTFGAAWPVVHNIYLLTWSEQGTLGFIFFLGMFGSIFAAAIRNIQRYYSDVLFAVNLGLLCGVVALCVDGLASFYLRVAGPARMFWVIAALVFVIDNWNRANARRFQPQPAAAPAPAPRSPVPASPDTPEAPATA